MWKIMMLNYTWLVCTKDRGYVVYVSRIDLICPKSKGGFSLLLLDPSPAFLTSDDFITSNEIVRTKLPIYLVISHFVLTI